MTAVAVTQEFLNRGKGLSDLSAALVAIPTADKKINFPNDGNIILVVEVTTGPMTITVEGVPDPYGRSADEVFTAVATGKSVFVSFMAPAMFNSGGNAEVTFSVDTGKYGLFRLTKSN